MQNFTFGGVFGEEVQLALLVHAIIILVRSESQSGTCSNDSKKKSGRDPSLMPPIWRTGKLLEANENNEALLQCPDAQLDDTQWHALVKYWKDKKVQLKTQGLLASRLDVFSKSRIGKDGVILDKETMTILLLIKDCIAQVFQEDCTKAMKEQMFKKFMGEDNHGYTDCVGRTSRTKPYQEISSTTLTIESIPQDVLQQIIQMVKEELCGDEQEEFKGTLKSSTS
ncbi:hypothetical protein M9H77_26866 [Catharanthus roseus]|uniref:Uncharacterized protein n=1 Tax=Catharanthus roseus TaxID=4058 RepID=A0ACC0AF58_CATRO|nr:hypothetical protein M9H77_26866 [Catharanthus roseus]